MPHISKQDLAELAKTRPLEARAILLANHAQYVRDGFIGDPAPTTGAPAAGGAAAPPPTSNPPSTPPTLSFRERVLAAEKATPMAGRVMVLQDPAAYLDGSAGPQPVTPAADGGQK